MEMGSARVRRGPRPEAITDGWLSSVKAEFCTSDLSAIGSGSGDAYPEMRRISWIDPGLIWLRLTLYKSKSMSL